MIKFVYLTLGMLIGVSFGIMFMGLQNPLSRIMEIKTYDSNERNIGYCLMEENTFLDGYLNSEQKLNLLTNIRSQDSENIIILFSPNKMTVIIITNAAWKLPAFGCVFQ